MAMEEDFCLLGIVTDEPDYKLCWMINQAIEVNFEKLEDLNLYHRKLQEDQSFSLYEYHDEDTLVTYRIIKNRTSNGYFLDDLKNLDYLVHIQGEIKKDKINEFMHAAGTLVSVRMCVPVDLIRIRNKERFLLW